MDWGWVNVEVDHAFWSTTELSTDPRVRFDSQSLERALPDQLLGPEWQKTDIVSGHGRPLIGGLHFPHHLVQVEASGLLSDRKFLEALKRPRDDRLRRHHDEGPRAEEVAEVSLRLGARSDWSERRW
jgi:hypothetical protein